MPLDLAFPAALGIMSGLLIGSIGIGGVVIVPALVYLAGIPVQVAIPAAMMGYCLTGAVGATVYAGHKSIDWPMAIWLCGGAAPAALAGAWASNILPAVALELMIGALTLASGVQTSLAAFSKAKKSPMMLGPVLLVLIGAVTGLLSSLTGTGGPLVLVPVMMWLDVPVLTAIGLAQAIQLPIAAVATAGNAAFGVLDLTLGAALALGLVGGTYLGARLTHALPGRILKRAVGAVLIIVGGAVVARAIAHVLA